MPHRNNTTRIELSMQVFCHDLGVGLDIIVKKEAESTSGGLNAPVQCGGLTSRFLPQYGEIETELVL